MSTSLADIILRIGVCFFSEITFEMNFNEVFGKGFRK